MLNPPDGRPGAAARLAEAASFMAQGKLRLAQKACKEILRRNPGDFDALHLSGVLALRSGDGRSAVTLFDRAVKAQPMDAIVWSNRGSALQSLGHLEDAVASYETALALQPGFVAAHFNRATTLRRLQRPEQALAGFNRVIALDARNTDAYLCRCAVLQDLERHTEALASVDHVLAIAGDQVPALFLRARSLRSLGRLEEALTSYDRALAAGGELAEILGNRGNLLNELNRLDAAIESYDRALALQPNDAEIHCNKAEFEWRRKRSLEPAGVPASSLAEVPGKTVLVRAEQGFGDSLQFCRYLPLLERAGAQVIFEVQPPLLRLMRSLEGSVRVRPKNGERPASDLTVPLLSLPLLFNTSLANLPAPSRYLDSDASERQRWELRLGERTKPRVGLVWAGSQVQLNNRRVSLADLAACLPAGIDYVSLQKDLSQADAELLRSRADLRSFADELHDFSDTAALCDCLDLVVSIDTGVAHLSGALGKPTWVLLPFNPDWRWLLERTDSPWYPSLRLLRQARIGDWRPVLEELAAGLLARFPGARLA